MSGNVADLERRLANLGTQQQQSQSNPAEAAPPAFAQPPPVPAPVTTAAALPSVALGGGKTDLLVSE